MVNVFLIVIVALLSTIKPSEVNSNGNNTIVYIQTIDSVEPGNISVVKNAIESFYGFKCIIKPGVKSSKDILSISKTRLDALKILKKFNSKENLLLITEKDIATKKGNISEYGIFGLGFRPGNVCVVSTYRLKRNVNRDRFVDRLTKISIHEVGHNLGLEHCNNDIHCIMNDARGTISQVDKEKMWICPPCTKKINL
jgi:archaemetzincin